MRGLSGDLRFEIQRKVSSLGEAPTLKSWRELCKANAPSGGGEEAAELPALSPRQRRMGQLDALVG